MHNPLRAQRYREGVAGPPHAAQATDDPADLAFAFVEDPRIAGAHTDVRARVVNLSRLAIRSVWLHIAHGRF